MKVTYYYIVERILTFNGILQNGKLLMVFSKCHGPRDGYGPSREGSSPPPPLIPYSPIEPLLGAGALPPLLRWCWLRLRTRRHGGQAATPSSCVMASTTVEGCCQGDHVHARGLCEIHLPHLSQAG
jgi:hypothetical protein